MTETVITGNLVADIEIRHTQGGKAVGNVRVAVSEGKDKPSSFYNVTLWEDMAERAAASVRKGDRVVAAGRLVMREFEDKQGLKRVSPDLTADSFGPDLRWATAVVTKAQGGGQGGSGVPAGGSGAAGWHNPSPAPSQAAHGAPGGFADYSGDSPF